MLANAMYLSEHSSKILTIQQGITRGVSSVAKPCRPVTRKFERVKVSKWKSDTT